MHFVALISLSLAIFSFVSPQVGMLGRGLRTTLPALVIAFTSIFMISSGAFIRAFLRFKATFLCGFIFLIQAALRFSYEDNAKNLWHTFFVSCLLILLLLLSIAAFTELGINMIRRLRFWVLIGWCGSLAVSLPTLISNPGVARLTMGNRYAIRNAAIWAPYGVGEYHVYTSLAICMGPLLFVVTELKGARRWIALPLLCLAATAVLFSTFTMASAMLILSFVATLLLWAYTGRGWSKIFRILLVFLAIALLPLFYFQAKTFSQTEFIVSKVDRLYSGISKAGLEKGDETYRGKMFMKDMRAFYESPFLGYIPGVQGQKDHGHSSLANSLVLFGVLGSAFWAIALYKIFKDSLDNEDNLFGRRILLISWFVFFISGILNPIWHSPAALGALIALTLPARKVQISS